MPTRPIDPPITKADPSKGVKSLTGMLVIVSLLLAAGAYFLKVKQGGQNETSVLAYLPALQIREAERPLLETKQSDPEPVTIPRLTSETLVDKSLEVGTAEQNSGPELPAYDQANGFIAEQLGLERWQALDPDGKILSGLHKEHFLQRSMAFLDGLSRGAALYKLSPFNQPDSRFVADGQGKALSMGDANFLRYDLFTRNITAIDVTKAAAFFHWTRPLLETAYSELGYPAEDLGGALISAIDIIIAAPAIETPVALKHESVLYQYADPAVEALPSAQKQLIRMGPNNSAALKHWLARLRQALLSTPVDG